MHCLDDLGVAGLDFTDVGLCVLNVLFDLIYDVLQVLILQRELFLKFMDDFLAGIDEDCTCLIDAVYLLDGLVRTVLTNQRSVSELEVPRNIIQIIES